MKNVCVTLLMLWFTTSGCRKETERINESYTVLEQDIIRPQLFNRPSLPDTSREPTIPVWIPLPGHPVGETIVPIKLQQCVYSYNELASALGTHKLNIKAVVLDGGAAGDILLERSDNLPAIWYTAVPAATGNSLFTSQLQVEWRPDVTVYFSGFTAEVWSLGCVYQQVVNGPFTNILKGQVEVLINTLFFWGVGEYAGKRIKYLVTD